MVQTGTWTGRAPVQRNIIDLFISHSYYLATHRKLFPKVNAYPELRRWMNGDPDGPSDEEAWGLKKTTSPYTFKDLAIFLDNNGTLNPSKAHTMQESKSRKDEDKERKGERKERKEKEKEKEKEEKEKTKEKQKSRK